MTTLSFTRRDAMRGAAAFALLGGTHFLRLDQASALTPVTGPGFSRLDISVTDETVMLPDSIPAGRYEVNVSYTGQVGSHLSIGRFPDSFTEDRIAMVFDDDPENDGTTEEFFSLGWVGLPDWPLTGGSVSGIVDFAAGEYLVIDPISPRPPQRLRVEGDVAEAADPEAEIVLTLREMALELSSAAVPAGPQLWKVVNEGAFTHEFSIVPVKPETTNDDLAAYMAWAMAQPEGGTPTSAPPTGDKIDLSTYSPAAAMSLLRPGGTSWVTVDLTAGPYALLCMAPGPTDDMPPHALMGMHAVFTVA